MIQESMFLFSFENTVCLLKSTENVFESCNALSISELETHTYTHIA